MTITLLQLKTQARQRADMENSEFITDAELTTYINSSVAELHDLLVGTYGPDYYVENEIIAVTDGTEEYELPDDFYKLKGVDAQVNGNEYCSLRPFNFNERNRTFSSEMTNLRYRLLGNSLRLSPAPSGTFNLRLWYIPVATPLVADADIFNDINSYAEYVITDAAIKMLQKEESDVSVLSAQKMDLRKRIENMAQNRDADNPESISDIHAEGDDYGNSRY